MMSLNLRHQIVGLPLTIMIATALTCVSPVNAQFIQGVSIDSVSSELGGFQRFAVDAINGSGFDEVNGTHTSNAGDMWLSNGTFAAPNDPFPLFPEDTNPFIVFDLGAVYDLSALNVWNYNEAPPSLSNRGARDVTISAGLTSGALTPLDNGNNGDFIFAQADETATYAGEQFDLSAMTVVDAARFVRFDFFSNHGGDNEFVGLAEVRFTGSIVNNDLIWVGGNGTAWDVQTTANWTGDNTVFSTGDNVTFDATGNPTVTVDEPVSPFNVRFNPGGTTYNVTGSNSIAASGTFDVDSGTVQLQNDGNSFAGLATVASGSRLEMNTGSVGGMVLNGTLSVGGAGTITPGTGAQTFFVDDFSGDGTLPLNGTTPDTSFDSSTWVAAPVFTDDGSNVTSGITSNGASGTLGFSPVDGAVYVLEVSLEGTTSADGAEEWFAFGFANGQSDQDGGGSQFTGGAVGGVVWGLHRGNDMASDNQTFLGTDIAPIQNVQSWDTPTNTAGGDADIRITLDTTGGPGNWTALFEADAFDGNGFQVIRAEETVFSELISSVGFAIDSSAVSGRVSSFSLTGNDVDYLEGDILTVNGDFTMDASSTLELDIAIAGQDFVDVSGIATLNGTIDVSFLSADDPILGTSYTLLSAAQGIVDSGVSFILPAGATASIVGSTDLVLSFASAAITGDYNDDGVVDLADYTIWRNNLGEAETVLPDGTYTPGDGIVGEEEYTAWRANFGATSLLSSGTNTSVPEPGTWLLALLGCTIAYTRLRSNKRH